MLSNNSNNKAVTGIIICDHGSRRAQSNDSLKDIAKRFSARFSSECQIVEPAHMELAMPDISTAYAACVEQGATHVVVLPLFLAKGKHWTRDIPSLTSQAAARFPQSTYGRQWSGRLKIRCHSPFALTPLHEGIQLFNDSHIHGRWFKLG